MSKVELVEVNTPLNSSSFQDQINSNFTALSEALDNQLQRTSQAGVDNEMHQDLDMGSEYRIINLAAPINTSDAARKQDVLDGIAQSKEYAERAETAAGLAEGYASDALASKRAAAAAAQTAVDAKDIAVDAKNKAVAAKEAAEDKAQAASDATDLAQDWATKTDGTVDGNEYSAKYYAEQAEAIVADLAISNASDVQLNNLTNGEVLIWDSTDQKWENGKINSLPDQEGNSGKFLTTNGVTASWGKIGTTLADIAEAGTGIAFSSPIGPSENFTVVGNPTIVDGVASNFYYDRYIYVDETFDVTGKSWELEGSFVSTYYAGEDHYCCGRYNPFTPFIVGTNSSGQPIAKIESNQLTNSSDPITLNTKHLFVLSFDKDTSTYTFNTKEESAGSWVTTTLQGDPITTIKPFCIGNALGYNPWMGSLDLTDYKLKIDNAVAWESYTIRPAEKTTISSTVVGLPSQTGQSGKYLTTNGSEASWDNVETLPSQAGNAGKFLTTDGTDTSWGDPLPSQAGNAKKFLTTDGVDAEWVAKDDYYQSLTSTQETTLTTYGTYNGELVADGTRFVKEDGTIQKFVDVATPGGFDTSIPTPPVTDASIWFKNALITANAAWGGWGEWKTTDRGVTYTQTGSYKVNSFVCNNNVCIGNDSSSACITTDGTTWTSYTNADFLSMKSWPKVSSPNIMIVYTSSGSTSNYIYSEDDGTTWVNVLFSTIFEGTEYVSKIVYVGNKFYMYTSENTGRAKYVYVSSDGKNWSGRTAISLGEVRTDSYSQMYGCGDKIFYFPQNQALAYYSTDGANFNTISTGIPSAYFTPVVVYCAGTQTYVALYRYVTFYLTSSNGIDWTTTTDLPDRTGTDIAFIGPADDYVLLNAGSWVRVNTGVTHTYSMEPLSLNKTQVETAVGGVLPSQTGQSGKFLTTDGSSASWANVDALPDQTGQSGKVLTTNGTTASWATLATSSYDPVTQTITLG